MDYKLFWSINKFAGRNHFIDNLMIFFSNKTRYFFALILVILFFRNGSTRKTAVNAFISLLFSFAMHVLISLFSFKPRPFMKNRVGILIPSKIDTSFPSKHAILLFAVATSVFLREKILGKFMLAIASLTSFSRIWVGHHYPSDISYSIIIGSTISVIVDKIPLFNKIESKQFND